MDTSTDTAVASPSEQDASVLPSERIAGGILPRVLTTLDMIAIYVAIVLFITNAPGVASAGGVGYIYWVLGFLTFLIPGAIVTGQLGQMFPGEGSLYVWTHKALGPFMGFFAGFCAWWPGILSIIAPGVVVVTFLQHFGSLFGMQVLTDPWQQGLVILGVLALSLVLSVIRFRVTQNIVTTIFLAYSGAIVLLGIAGVIWLVSGQPASMAGDSWTPTFGATGNFTIFGFVILALLGIEVPLNMGVEINEEKSINHYLFWGSIVIMSAYLIATFGVGMVIPGSEIGPMGPAALSEAVHRAFGPAGTILAAIFDLIIVGVFLFNASVFNYSFGRLLFISGLDRRLPVAMSKVNANKVPWVAVVVQTAIAAVFVLAIYLIGPLVSATDPASLSILMYYVILASVTIIWVISMLILFVDVLVIHRKYPEAFARVQLAPNWVFYLCSLLGLVASGVGLYATLSAPWVPLIDHFGWNTWILSIAGISLLAGVVIYFVGQMAARNSISDEELIKKVTS